MSIAETVPQDGFYVSLDFGMEKIVISRGDWEVELGHFGSSPVVRCSGQEYVYSDGCLVPRASLEKPGNQSVRVQVGQFVGNIEDHTDRPNKVPLAPNQAAFLRCGRHSVTFNMAAAPVITWEEHEYRVFDKPIDYPSSGLSEKDIGQLIPGKGILIAPGVQFYDFTDRPVGPPLNYFLAPQTLGQLSEKFKPACFARDAVSTISEVEILGQPGGGGQDAYDLMNAAMRDIKQLGQWHMPPLEIMAGISEIGGRPVNPHHIIREILDQHGLPYGKYVALVRNYQGKKSGQLMVEMAYGRPEIEISRCRSIDGNMVIEQCTSVLLARAEPA